MRFEMLHPADQLVMMLDRIYHYGMTTTSGGNLSVLDDNGDIWITPSGIDKGSLTRRDIMQVKPDGTVIGPHTPSVELPFHRHIYKLRPDIRAIVHAHPPTLVAFSLARKNPDFFLTPEIQQLCGRVDMEPYAVPGSERLGDYIAEKFAEGCDSVMMENHGVVCGAANLEKAFMAQAHHARADRFRRPGARAARLHPRPALQRGGRRPARPVRVLPPLL